MQEALRVIEEFARGGDPELAQRGCGDPLSPLRPGSGIAPSRRFERSAQPLRGGCRLYLVTRPAPDLLAVVEAALAGGVRLVQYRAKEGSLPPMASRSPMPNASSRPWHCASFAAGMVPCFW